MRHAASDPLKLIASMVIFGTIGLVRRFIPYPSSVIALARALIGTVFLLSLHFLRRERLSWGALRRNALPLCASGVLLGFNWIFLFEAYRYTSVSVATMCYYMAPVLVILASPLLLHEALTARRGLCALAAVAGMVLVSGVLESGVSGLRGILFGLAAACMYAGIVLLNKIIRGLSANERTLVQLAIAAAALTPYVLLTENVAALETGPFVLGMLLLAGVVHTGIAYSLYFGSIRSIPAQTAALFSYIDPIVAVLLSVLVLRERLSPLSAFGVIVVLGAMAASELPLHRFAGRAS